MRIMRLGMVIMPGSGFPNAAEEAGAEPLNLHKLIVKHPASTFFMRVDSDSYAEIGIYSGDVLTIDRSLTVQPNDMVIVHLEGDFVLRQYRLNDGQAHLWGGTDESPVPLTSESDNLIWGVVSHAIHDFRKDIVF